MMHIFDIVNAICLLVVTFGLFAIIAASLPDSVTSDALTDDEHPTATPKTTPSVMKELPPVGMPNKGHRKPSAAVAKIMSAMRALDAGRPAHAVALAFGYEDVTRLEREIKSNGRQARALLCREV